MAHDGASFLCCCNNKDHSQSGLNNHKHCLSAPEARSPGSGAGLAPASLLALAL